MVTVLVPDAVGDLHPDKIKSLAHVISHAGELGLGKPPHAALTHLSIIKTSTVAQHIGAFSPSWQKSIQDGC
jgi:hypothetical protein